LWEATYLDLGKWFYHSVLDKTAGGLSDRSSSCGVRVASSAGSTTRSRFGGTGRTPWRAGRSRAATIWRRTTRPRRWPRSSLSWQA